MKKEPLEIHSLPDWLFELIVYATIITGITVGATIQGLYWSLHIVFFLPTYLLLLKVVQLGILTEKSLNLNDKMLDSMKELMSGLNKMVDNMKQEDKTKLNPPVPTVPVQDNASKI